MQGLPAPSDFSSLMDLTGGDPWSLASTRAKRVYSREFKIHFIREVRLRPNLWDPSHEFHCRQDMSKKTWKELAAVMNEEFPEFPIESKDIRKLYKNLRDMYKVRRNEAREAKGEETPGTRWEYYSDMSFLSHIIDMMEDQRADSCQLDVLNVIEDNDDKSTDSDEKSSTRVLLDADQAKALDVTALFGEPASSTSSSQHNGLVKEEPQEFDFQLFSEPTPSEKATGTPKRYDRLGRLLPPSRWPRPRTFPLKRKSVTSRAAAAKLPINTQAPLSSCQQSSNAAPAATLPPVISFMLDKYNAFKNRSPDLANQFENELLKVVINFNDQKTDNAK